MYDVNLTKERPVYWTLEVKLYKVFGFEDGAVYETEGEPDNYFRPKHKILRIFGQKQELLFKILQNNCCAYILTQNSCSVISRLLNNYLVETFTITNCTVTF